MSDHLPYTGSTVLSDGAVRHVGIHWSVVQTYPPSFIDGEMPLNHLPRSHHPFQLFFWVAPATLPPGVLAGRRDGRGEAGCAHAGMG